MSERVERARLLGEQLSVTMDQLGAATDGSSALLFLELLGRLEGYPEAELGAVAGLRELVREARDARTEHALELGKAAGLSVDLDRLLHAGRAIPAEDHSGDRDSWLRDLLLLATVTPWLSRPRQMLASGALAKARAMIEAEPEAFLGASALAKDRRALEQPSALGAEARELLALLEDLPLLVVFDRAPEARSVARVDAAIQAAEADLLDEVEDALINHVRRRALRLPSTAGDDRMAAAGETALVLLSMEAGRWVYVQRGGLASLRFEPLAASSDVSVDVSEGTELRALPLGPSGEFILPTSAGTLILRLRVGPDSRKLTLEPSER